MRPIGRVGDGGIEQHGRSLISTIALFWNIFYCRICFVKFWLKKVIKLVITVACKGRSKICRIAIASDDGFDRYCQLLDYRISALLSNPMTETSLICSRFQQALLLIRYILQVINLWSVRHEYT